MGKEFKIIHVAYSVTGTPDKKGIGRQLITWLHRGYRLVERQEVSGKRPIQSYTVLRFAKDP